MNKHHQFYLAIFSICLVFLLGLSTVNRTIHDGLFHPNFITENNTISPGCSVSHEGDCTDNKSNSHTQECDASCPVNIFSNGVLALDQVSEILAKTSIKSEIVSEYLISQFSAGEKKTYFARGPPEENKV